MPRTFSLYFYFAFFNFSIFQFLYIFIFGFYYISISAFFYFSIYLFLYFRILHFSIFVFSLLSSLLCCYASIYLSMHLHGKSRIFLCVIYNLKEFFFFFLWSYSWATVICFLSLFRQKDYIT